jgi:hypothetical protein
VAKGRGASAAWELCADGLVPAVWEVRSVWSHRRISLACVMCYQEIAFVEEDDNTTNPIVAHAKKGERNGAFAPLAGMRR